MRSKVYLSSGETSVEWKSILARLPLDYRLTIDSQIRKG